VSHTQKRQYFTNLSASRVLSLVSSIVVLWQIDRHFGAQRMLNSLENITLLLLPNSLISDASIYRKYGNIDSISIYRIISYHPRKYRNFRYTGINVLIYHLAEFSRVVSRSREIFIETFTDSESFNESFSENFTTS